MSLRFINSSSSHQQLSRLLIAASIAIVDKLLDPPIVDLQRGLRVLFLGGAGDTQRIIVAVPTFEVGLFYHRR